MKIPIPPFDPLGLPLPAPLLQGLAYLTLTLHLIAMQFTVGSALLLFLSWRTRPSVARFLGTGLPLGFSYLVTFGVPPLLFVQVMYGQFFYSSSVLIGAYWIAVIPLIILGYGASYWHRMTRDNHHRGQVWRIGVTVLALFLVGFIYVNNLTLSMRPERWLDHYTRAPNGTTLNLQEPTLWPRYLMFLAPSLTAVGLALVLRAAWLRKCNSIAESRLSQAWGSRSVLVSALLVAIAAVAMLRTLPEKIASELAAGGRMTILAATAVALGMLTLLAAFRSGRKPNLGPALLASHCFLGAMACLVVLRDWIRQAYLAPYFDLAKAPVHAQWGMFVLFVVVLLVGVVFLAILTRYTVQRLLGTQLPPEVPSAQNGV